MLRVKKVYNNNILLVEDSNSDEMIITGRGIGFGLKTKDQIDETKIDKRYRLESEDLQNRFVSLMNDIPTQHLEIAERILQQAKDELNVEFDDSVLIGLTDHINYAIKRAKNHEEITNALLWEIKKFYPKEFQTAVHTLDIIKYYEGIQMDENEACFIALHFVNGQQSGEGVSNAVLATNVIHDILNIIKFHFRMEFNEQSDFYIRFVTHIRYFLQRTHNQFSEEDDFLFEQVKAKYQEVYECVDRIKYYMKQKLDIDLSNEEMLYFMLHVKKLTDSQY